jgi:hypothetical protein
MLDKLTGMRAFVVVVQDRLFCRGRRPARYIASDGGPPYRHT